MDTEFVTTTKSSRGQVGILRRALGLAKWPVVIALLVTPIRFTLELAGLPDSAIFLIGLLWFTLGFSIFWGVRIFNEERAYLKLLLTLVIFSPLSRIPVSILWWIDNQLEIGTHYGLYFNNFPQAFLNQVIYGSIIQIIPGLVLGSITIGLLRCRQLKKQ